MRNVLISLLPDIEGMNRLDLCSQAACCLDKGESKDAEGEGICTRQAVFCGEGGHTHTFLQKKDALRPDPQRGRKDGEASDSYRVTLPAPATCR